MRSPFVAIAFVALAGTAASAASLTKTVYSHPHEAARAGAAYHLDKALGRGVFEANDLKVSHILSEKGPRTRYQVVTDPASGKPNKKVGVTVLHDGPGKYRAYIPNRHVYTPPTVGNP
jgi:hypothetical protein